MRFPDSMKGGHKPPQSEVCITFWIDRAMARQLVAFARRQHIDRSTMIRDALVEYMERGRAKY